MLIRIVRAIVLFGLCLVAHNYGLHAQVNAGEQHIDLLPGEEFEFQLKSASGTFPVLSGQERFWDLADLSSPQNPISNTGLSEDGYDIFKLSLKVKEEFTGEASYRFSYTDLDSSGAPAKKYYSTIYFNVQSSFLKTKHDYQTVAIGDRNVRVNVVENDFSTHHPVSLDQIVFSQNGTASIVGNGSLRFTPDDGFAGMAYVNYVAKNPEGITARGTVTFCVIDPSAVVEYDTVRVSTAQNSAVPILFPFDNVDVSGEFGPQLGTVEVLSKDVIEYLPSLDVHGSDEFMIVSDDGTERWVIVQIVEREKNTSGLKDDHVFTEVGKKVSFNPLKNDFSTSHELAYFSQQLEHSGLGNFSYQPPKRFKGVKKFTYASDNGFERQTANIYIHIDNFEPEQKTAYQLVTEKNTPLILEYNVPIDEYEFEMVEYPSNGFAISYNESIIYAYNCGRVTGDKLVVYEPDRDFVGEDSFIINYCVDGHDCTPVQISVEVLESEKDCGCAGSDCVWSGDVNNDGKVNVTDLLPLGYYMGEMGTRRSENSGNDWIAQNADDWSAAQASSGNDLKFIDTNGDGLISISDTVGISENYSEYHNLVHGESLVIKDLDFALNPLTTSLNPGDLLLLDVFLGSEENPILDIHGFAYNINFAAEFVDSSSLFVDFADHVWFGNNSPTIHMFKQPRDGKVDVGSTRTTGELVTGFGKIHTLGIIIGDEVDGFRAKGNSITMDIDVSDIQIMDGSGSKFGLPSQTITVTINLPEGAETTTADDVIIYPNPASRDLNIHLNGIDIIRGVELYDLTGKQVYRESNLNEVQTVVPVDQLTEGIYVARITTTQGTFSKKVQVYNRP